MNARTDSIIRQIAPRTAPSAPAQRNPLQRALDDYHDMEGELNRALARAAELTTTNNALLAEANMLREALERADADRIRLQAVSSVLLGRLLSINDVIGGAVRASIKEGIEAEQEARPEEGLERAGAEAQAILQRVQPQERIEPPETRMMPPESPQGLGATVPRNQFLR
jgi:hypothetical protein